ncbi:ankyrin repeat-containing domain protein [Radiomyces spectabilis]|uniref:ankyrin repeat-containing domain protein n=1 Tax=Radiomyces spectabilis TaxID=64574 RepID=UPI002221168A|nr:ankyrin repeat-containing domain protein [Radiomyces spectabilis]KAI8388766.1 ankyrin repeat-containing domain protein [Radiomyces spectabilis]
MHASRRPLFSTPCHSTSQNYDIHLDQQLHQITIRDEHHLKDRLSELPMELKIRIFVLAQNPQLVKSASTFWKLSRASMVRARYLVQRFGKTAALGERSMSYRIVSLQVIADILKLRCNPRADGDWLFWKACENHHEQLAKMLLDAMQPSKETLHHLLNVAAMKGANNIIDLLVHQYGADIHHNGDDLVLMLACAENQVDVVRHLARHYNCDLHSNRERHLRRACLHGYTDLVDLLIPGADIHAYNDAALQNAAHKGHAAIVARLIDVGANAAANDNAPIQYAVVHGNTSLVACLIAAGADPRCHQDKPLRIASRHDVVGVIALLLRHGADPNTGKGVPLREAIRAGHVAVVNVLLQFGADRHAYGALKGLADAIVKNDLDMVRFLTKAGARLDHNWIAQTMRSAKRKISKPMQQLVADWHDSRSNNAADH